jgi:hypothetical protein
MNFHLIRSFEVKGLQIINTGYTDVELSMTFISCFLMVILYIAVL